MIGIRSRLSLVILFVPALLLGATAAVRVALMQPWTVWQPPIDEPWLPNAQAPPAEIVGRNLFGGRLYSPRTVLARARVAGTAAAATLVLVAAVLVLLGRFRLLAARPSPWAAWICGTARAALRVSGLLAIVYLLELLAAVYFLEVLLSGGATFVTPAYGCLIVLGSAVHLYRVWSEPGADTPAPRINANLLDRAEQPELFAELARIAKAAAECGVEHVAAMLEPDFAMAVGPLQCGETVVEGYIALVSLPLSACLTVEEFRAVAAQSFAPIAWHGGAYASRIRGVHRRAEQLYRKLAPRDTTVGRVSVFLPRLGFCMLALQPAEDESQRFADAVTEADRIAAARFGSRDLARGLLKSHVALDLWPPYYREMTAQLKCGQPHAYEFIGRGFAEHVAEKGIAAGVPEVLRTRLERLGIDGLPALDFQPAESALALFRVARSLDRALSAAERARVVFERQVEYSLAHDPHP
jgi:hypothetical protein